MVLKVGDFLIDSVTGRQVHNSHRPGEVRPGEVRPGEVRPGEVRPGEVRAIDWLKSRR